MTREQWEQLKALLIQFADEDLDQFVSWKLQARDSPIYVDISVRPMLDMENLYYTPFEE